ncbi:kinetochore complex Sim4 subunit Fta1-domain-containing protein [Nemania abortiva]|nr:kinetochore complex Sim4 subunit Fta1-domain-containing protein [Nemania abortiva]
MPPRKRGRPAAVEAPQPGPESEAEASASDDDDNASQADPAHDSDDAGGDSARRQREAEEPDFKFFNTTFSTFRVSPLYTAQNALTAAGLQTLSRRLRDTLVGDVVRGVQVGLEGDATLGRLGVLERVEWRECSLHALLPTLADAETDAGAGADADAGVERIIKPGRSFLRRREARPKRNPRLLSLELAYERATFNALMLPSLDGRDAKEREKRNGDRDDGSGDTSSGLRGPPPWTQNIAGSGGRSRASNKDKDITSAFTHFPLLLTRMPASLKAVLVDFLSTTFDCRISPLHLGTRTLIRSWERWIEECGVSSSKGRVLNKDVALTLGFHLEPPQRPPTVMMPDTKTTGWPTADEEQQHGSKGGSDTPVPPLGLKTIDVIVPADEVRRFLRVGKNPTLLVSPDADKGNKNGRKRPADAAEQEKERLRRRKLGGGKDEEGWAWREDVSQPKNSETLPQDQDHDQDQKTDTAEIETFPQPFTDALAAYLAHHLALDIYHPGVRVLRVVCDAFALSEGRVKVFPPLRDGDDQSGMAAVEMFVRDLVRRAKGKDWSHAALRLANMKMVV